MNRECIPDVEYVVGPCVDNKTYFDECIVDMVNHFGKYRTRHFVVEVKKNQIAIGGYQKEEVGYLYTTTKYAVVVIYSETDVSWMWIGFADAMNRECIPDVGFVGRCVGNKTDFDGCIFYKVHHSGILQTRPHSGKDVVVVVGSLAFCWHFWNRVLCFVAEK
jgi:hypothetical protein